MQGTGYLFDKATGEKILCLVRSEKYGRSLKRRFSGKDGFHVTDEEIHLNEPEGKAALLKLKQGETISL